MRTTLDLNKTVEQNAEIYFEKAKKAKRKLAGAEKALKITEAKLQKAIKRKNSEGKKEENKTQRPRKWFEKFRWFLSSEGFLCIGGRDATTNEIVIKKHTEKNDLVFHTQMQGSPFFVVKTENKKPEQSTLEEVGIATGAFSRAWKLGITNPEVFYVDPSQVAKTAKAGEYVERGAFVITGKVNEMTVSMDLALGLTEDGMIMCGPSKAVEKNCSKRILITQGNQKTSDAAKLIKKKIGGELDEIIRALPSGGIKIPKIQ